MFWIEDKGKWVDSDGHTVELPPDDDPLRPWTPVELEGRRVGAIVHDLDACRGPRAAALGGRRRRAWRWRTSGSRPQLRARVEELRASRARIVEAGTHERRRLERNLHDGAQQRLVALSLTLRLAQAKLRKDPDSADALLTAAQEELTLALGELRELARGIHPAILSDRGLGAALEALAGRAPIAVELADVPAEPLPEAIEAAAYFVIAEALTNVVKYAHASQATVQREPPQRPRRGRGRRRRDRRRRSGPRSGLRGLADRVSALDGSMELDSPAGIGH